MNSTAEQFDHQNHKNDHGDLPESVAADRYGKESAPDALKRWQSDYSELLEQVIDSIPSQAILDELACLKDGLLIITERAWTKGQIQATEAWWKPDELMEDGESWLENLRKVSKSQENDQLMRDLQRTMELLKHRFRVSEGNNYRVLYIMGAIAAAIAAIAHVIPERQNSADAAIIQAPAAPDESADIEATFDPFPVDPIAPTEKPKAQEKKVEPPKAQIDKVHTPKPAARKSDGAGSPQKGHDTIPDVGEREVKKIVKNNTEGSGTSTNLKGSGTGSDLQIGKGSGMKFGSGSGRASGGHLPEGIDTGGGNGRIGAELDTDILPLRGYTDALSGLSEGEKLRRVQKFLSQNGIQMDPHLAKVMKQRINGDAITDEDCKKAMDLNKKLRDQVRRVDATPMCRAVRTFLSIYYFGMCD